ncbi:potassium channel family protein [Streptomyces narbonensis]
MANYLHNLRKRRRQRLTEQHPPTGNQRVAVIGLGRFGSSLANELMRRGWDVLGIDTDARLVQKYSDSLTHAATADCTDPDVLNQLGVHDFSSAVVGIGSDIEASILISSNLLEAGVPNIWAKAISRRTARSSNASACTTSCFPSTRWASASPTSSPAACSTSSNSTTTTPSSRPWLPEPCTGQPLGQSRVRSEYGITVVGIKRPGEDFTYATANTVVEQGNIIVVTGKTSAVETFTELP